MFTIEINSNKGENNKIWIIIPCILFEIEIEIMIKKLKIEKKLIIKSYQKKKKT